MFGTLGTNNRATALLAEIEHGETTSEINAYVLQEVLAAFDRVQGISPAERDEYRTLFLTRLTRMTGLLESPYQRDATAISLEERRRAPEIRLLAQILDIQPKDAPVVVLAYRHADREPTILTNDEAFAECVPADYNLPEIAIDYVA